MSANEGTWIAVGIVKMPALCAALVGAVAVHALLVISVGMWFFSSAESSPTPPRPVYTMGQPIQVHLSDSSEPLPDETQFDRASEEHAKTEEAATPETPPSNTDATPLPRVATEVAEPEPAAGSEPGRASTESTQTAQRPPQPQRAIESLAACIARFLTYVDAAEVSAEPDRTAASAPGEETQAQGELSQPALAAVSEPPPAAERESPQSAPPATPKPAGITRAARVVDVPSPTYPRRSIRAGHEGTALVHVEVLADGTVGTVSLHESSGHRALDEAALRAARRGRYECAMSDGSTIVGQIIVPFEFHLHDH